MPEPKVRQTVVMGPYGSTATVHDVGQYTRTRCGTSWIGQPKYILWGLLNHDAVSLCRRCWPVHSPREQRQ